MRGKTVVMAVAILAAAVLQGETYDTFDVAAGEEKELPKSSTVTTLNVAGSLKVATGGGSTTKVLNLGGTAETPAKVRVSGSYSALTVSEQATIGANGGCGLLEIGGWYANFTIKKLVIDANTPLTPGSDYVDFLNVADYHCGFGNGGIVNQSGKTARICYKKGASDGWVLTGSDWGSYLFQEGDFVLEGTPNARIWINAGGGGTGFDAETYPSKLTKGDATVRTQGTCDMLLNNDSGLRCLQVGNVRFGHAGKIRINNIGVKVTGSVTIDPTVTEVSVGGDYSPYFDLNGHVVTSCTMKVEAGVVKSSAAGGVLAFAPAAGEVVSFSGPMESGAVRMCGEGTLELGAATVPALEILSGTVRVSDANTSVSSLVLAKGATLVIDGCAFAKPATFTNDGGTVTCVNGGTIAYAADESLFNPGLPTGVGKSGPGKLIVYDPSSLGGLVHAAEGTVAFSRMGLTAPYHRWTFKALSDCKAAPAQGHVKALIQSRLYLWDAEDGCVAQDAMSNAADLTPPGSLTAGQIAYQCAVSYKPDVSSWLKSLKKIFDNNNDRPILVEPVIDPGDSSTWLSYAYRLPANSKPVVDYDLGTEYYRPRTWTVEASDDGVNWVTVDNRVDVEPVDNSGYIRYFDGETPKRKFRLSGYVSAGVVNMPAALGVRADADATVDFTSVTGGQGVDSIVVDTAVGAGTVLNAKVLPNGVLSLLHVEGTVADGYKTGLRVSDWADLPNFDSWTVSVDGTVKRGWRVGVSDGELAVFKPGFVLIFR